MWMKVAIVHDFLVEYGGAERVVEVFLEMYPEAEIVTLMADLEKFPKKWRSYNVQKMLPRIGVVSRYPQYLWPYLVAGLRSRTWQEYDVVICSDNIWAKFVETGGVGKIIYQYSPSQTLYYFQKRQVERRGWISLVGEWVKGGLRRGEYLAVRRCERLVAISETVAQRMRRYYARWPDEIVFPGIVGADTMEDIDEVQSGVEVGDYVVVVARLVVQKKVDVVIKACKKLGKKLVVIGDGQVREELERMANGEEVKFVGQVEERQKWQYLGSATALVVPAVEDFGLVAVEALCCGLPVVAVRGGGVAEVIEEGVHGELYSEGEDGGLERVLAKFDRSSYKREVLRKRAQEFSKERFIKEIGRIVDEVVTKRVL
jgi:glycosyltransferase involved in cell wall biosynthesis